MAYVNRERRTPHRLGAAGLYGALVGLLGGLIGLGGAEFRLPLLIGVFGFPPLRAVILNKALSLVVVTTALPARAAAVPWGRVGEHWTVAANLLAGSLAGALLGASWATRLRSETLYRVIAVLLLAIAAVLMVGHGSHGAVGLPPGPVRGLIGVFAGLGIGVVASLLGVAAGELLIPTLVLLYGADLKLAGSLSLLVSLPTMLVGFSRYSRDASFSVVREHWRFLAAMALGSMLGSLGGGRLVGLVPDAVLLPTLALVLVVSAVKLWRHRDIGATRHVPDGTG